MSMVLMSEFPPTISHLSTGEFHAQFFYFVVCWYSLLRILAADVQKNGRPKAPVKASCIGTPIRALREGNGIAVGYPAASPLRGQPIRRCA